MATTRIIPIHLNKGKTLAHCLEKSTKYIKNPDKTDNGNLISSYACHPETASAEFALSKSEYKKITGRVQKSDVIAYQIRQSFKPGEITPQKANQIGYEFAKRFTKENHAFIVCTHIDKRHIHNHIIWNSTTLDCTRKFRNFWSSTTAVRNLSDIICAEHKLSVISNPKPHGLNYGEWLGEKRKPSNRDLLRMAIDKSLEKNPKDFKELVELLGDEGYIIKRKKNLSFKHKNQKQSIRLTSLGDGYSEAELRTIISSNKKRISSKKKYPQKEKPSLITQIQEKINSSKGYAYTQAMKVIKLKQMAKTFVYLESQNFKDYEELAKSADNAEARFSKLKETIKSTESRMSEIQDLRTHIINYSKTKATYVAYRKAGYSKKFFSEHEDEITIHKAAKKAFDELRVKKLPTVKSLNAEFEKLLRDKRSAYSEYRKAQSEMKELAIHKANAGFILDIKEEKTKTPVQHKRKEK